MGGWWLTIKRRRDGTELDFMLRETEGNATCLNVERAVLRADLDAVESLLDRIRHEIDRPRTRGIQGLLEQLGEAIATRLLPSEVRTTLEEAAPDRPSLTIETNDTAIPWELAQLRDAPLWAEFGLTRRLLRSGAVRRTEPKTDGRLTILAIVDPEENLPWAAAERKAIEQALSGFPDVGLEILEGRAATASAVIERLQSNPYTVLHIASHASHEVHDPSRSLIYLHDEPVPAARLFDVRYVAPPALVFVNACEGARTSTEHFGLAGVFADLGTRAFIGPLWPVSDRVSTAISALFYRALAGGSGVGEALRTARTVSAAETPDDPFASWAAYMVFGDGAALVRARPAPPAESPRFSLFKRPQPPRTTGFTVTPWELSVIEGRDAGLKCALSLPKIRIGRTDAPGLTDDRFGLTDPTVSREQATLIWDAAAGAYELEVGRATNPTFVNDVAVRKKQALKAGDQIRMGHVRLLFDLAAPQRTDPTLTGFTPLRPDDDPDRIVDVEGDSTSMWSLRPAFQLAIIAGMDKGRTLAIAASSALEGRTIPIGRRGSRNNEITLQDPYLSNTAASLQYADGSFWITNDSGDESLEVNGMAVATRYRLQPGDSIRCGQTVMVFERGDRAVGAREQRFRLDAVSIAGNVADDRFPLESRAMRIGRGNDSDIVIVDRTVSHHHATIVPRKGQFFLLHESRKNPTLVNGVEVDRERQLEHGDEIQLSGGTALRFVDQRLEVFDLR